MIDTKRETLVKVREANKHFAHRPSPKTVWRWTLKPLRDGRQLESVLIGGIRFTSEEAIQRFEQHCGPTPTTAYQRRTYRRQREQSIARAKRILDAKGVR